MKFYFKILNFICKDKFLLYDVIFSFGIIICAVFGPLFSFCLSAILISGDLAYRKRNLNTPAYYKSLDSEKKGDSYD